MTSGACTSVRGREGGGQKGRWAARAGPAERTGHGVRWPERPGELGPNQRRELGHKGKRKRERMIYGKC